MPVDKRLDGLFGVRTGSGDDRLVGVRADWSRLLARGSQLSPRIGMADHNVANPNGIFGTTIVFPNAVAYGGRVGPRRAMDVVTRRRCSRLGQDVPGRRDDRSSVSFARYTVGGCW